MFSVLFFSYPLPFFSLLSHFSPVDYWQYDLRTDAETAEMVLAYLSDAPFDTFEETETGLFAYLPAASDMAMAEEILTALAEQFTFTWEKTFLPGQNWNEIWESNFHPVVVGDFCAVRADFHEPIPGVRYELVINPKMAFGSGHHETTWQCIAAMEHLPMAGRKVLDYGCGTGILAILASKLGAVDLEAVDIESESYRNTLDNCLINDVHNVTALCGTLSDVQGHDFEGILANINRNVILDSSDPIGGNHPARRLAVSFRHFGTRRCYYNRNRRGEWF